MVREVGICDKARQNLFGRAKLHRRNRVVRCDRLDEAETLGHGWLPLPNPRVRTLPLNGHVSRGVCRRAGYDVAAYGIVFHRGELADHRQVVHGAQVADAFAVGGLAEGFVPVDEVRTTIWR
jgi:hypothetical protein